MTLTLVVILYTWHSVNSFQFVLRSCPEEQPNSESQYFPDDQHTRLQNYAEQKDPFTN